MFNTPAGLVPGPAIPRKVSAANSQGTWTEWPVLLRQEKAGAHDQGPVFIVADGCLLL